MSFARTQKALRPRFSLGVALLITALAACSGGPETVTTPAVPAGLLRSTAFSSKVIVSSGCTATTHGVGVAPAQLTLMIGETASFTACTKSGGTYEVTVLPAGIVSVPASMRASKSADLPLHSALIPVTAQAAGTAIITVSEKNGWAATVSVTVTDPTPTPSPTPVPILLYISNSSGSIATDRTGSAPQTLASNSFGLAGIAHDSSGDVFATAPNNNIVFEYSASGVGLATIYGFNTMLNAPHGIALDPAGNIYVANTGSNAITVFAAGANNNVSPIRTISGAGTGLNAPTGLAFDASGNLFVANNAGASITEFAPGANGNTAPVKTITGSGGPSAPWGVALDGAGNLYVNDRGTTSIYKFAPGSGLGATPLAVISGTALSGTYGIAVTAGGTIFAAQGDNAPGSIIEYAPGANGNATPAAVITGSALTNPFDVSL